MKRILIALSLLLPLASSASSPALIIELTDEVIAKHGFKVEVRKLGDINYFTLTAPLTIDEHWTPVTTQVNSIDETGKSTLSKVGLGKPTEPVSISVYYKPNTGRLEVGIYYGCRVDVAQCVGWAHGRLYLLKSVESRPAIVNKADPRAIPTIIQ